MMMGMAGHRRPSWSPREKIPSGRWERGVHSSPLNRPIRARGGSWSLSKRAGRGWQRGMGRLCDSGLEDRFLRRSKQRRRILLMRSQQQLLLHHKRLWLAKEREKQKEPNRRQENDRMSLVQSCGYSS